jgi:hypothetical protein
LQVLIRGCIAILVDLASFAFPWPNSIDFPSDLAIFEPFFRQNRVFSRLGHEQRPDPVLPGQVRYYRPFKKNWNFWKTVLAITFDSGLRFWCSLARFEATIKAFVTIAEDPSSTTTKIRGQARSFYNKG